MEVYRNYTALVTADRERRANFHTMLSCVLPRPIAFVSTVSADGVANLAPYSFFNGVGSNPPAVMFSPCTRADGTQKDTILNLQDVPEFVVNVVPHSIAEAMNQASYQYGPEVNEFEAAGFTPLAGKLVRPPRAAESPVHLECKLVQIVSVGDGPLSANVCIGSIECFHVADGFLLDDGTVDVEKIDLIGRMGGDWYSRIRDRFELSKPTGPPM
jgi:flavin reductase (DIM6/NTAB) family NADH-FMN oxidoreductase RutF